MASPSSNDGLDEARPPIYDSVEVPLNACSLEVLTSPILIPGRSGTHCMQAWPLVVGCYQLNESGDGAGGRPVDEEAGAEDADNATGTDGDGEGGGRSSESNEEGADAGDEGCDGDDDDDDDEEEGNTAGTAATRSGELRLYTVPTAPPDDGSEYQRRHHKLFKFGDPVQVLRAESGVLDGKWRTIVAAPALASDITCNGGVDSEKKGDKMNDKEGSRHLFATASASGRVNVHELTPAEGEGCAAAAAGTAGGTSGCPRLVQIASSSSPVTNGDNAEESSKSRKRLCLSLDWDRSAFATCGLQSCTCPTAGPDSVDLGDSTTAPSEQRIVSSYSDGTLAIHSVHLNHGGGREDPTRQPRNEAKTPLVALEEIERWDAHSMFGCPSEVWTCCFASPASSSAFAQSTISSSAMPPILSGGDDCALKLWDTRSPPAPVAKIGQQEFEAGVTAVSYHPRLDHVFAVGSYDETVRIYDIRKFGGGSSRSEPLCRVNVGGGVWRVRWHPVLDGRLLVAAMHGGCRVVHVDGLDCAGGSTNGGAEAGGEVQLQQHIDLRAKVVAEFSEHKSMAYGADWLVCRGVGRGAGLGEKVYLHEVAASCSFYDRRALLWAAANGGFIKSLNSSGQEGQASHSRH